MKKSTLMLECVSVFLLLGAAAISSAADADPVCGSIRDVEGDYQCAGECVVRSGDDTNSVVTVSGELDVVRRIAGATEPLYRIEISGSDNFREVEIGALSGRIMRTATARVSDGNFPVLEEYVFEHDDACSAVGYTKIVRNPSALHFKACSITCSKRP